ncbi:11866_t:CDS:2 [Diversispora eburnea]|uniref:11866_t:CDS:1 n=1 Tax=Diversispora eburnea TaxID=1213867 RepID=A0A9N8V3C6_9GLOM|nr:11866_t:CDS:2 [Diversispora eburnea]
MDSVKVTNVQIHGVKDSIQNEVNLEETSPSHVDTSTDGKPTISNITPNKQQTHSTPQKENISDPKGHNLSTTTQTSSTSGSHDMNVLKTTTANYTPESVNFSSPSTPIDSNTLGSFNQFSVNPEKTTPGQPNSPNNAAKAKPFVCTVCNQTFSRQHNLKSHALTHSQEKPFQCDICQHFFRRHHDLKRHQKLHTGEKPYQCPHCKRSFARLDALNRHLRAESFCGGPQKKIYSTDSKIEQQQQLQQQPPPIHLSPQQTTPQPQLLSIQSQPQGDITTKSPNQQPDPKANASSQQIVQPQQQFKKPQEDLQNKQTTNLSNNNNNSQAKTDISRQQSQDFYKRQQMIQHDQYHAWQHQPLQTQQSAQIQSIPSPNTQSLAKPVQNLVIPNSTHHQFVFPVETPASISTNATAPHYQMQYSHNQSEFNVQVPDSQRRPPEALMSNEQDIDGRVIHNKASSQREMQLIGRNNYLEERVRELENEVINERKSRARREFLETKVTELEIEKKLLKQLLLERDTNGSLDTSQNHEKKRKSTSSMESPNPSKHQKDGDRIIIQQSSQ